MEPRSLPTSSPPLIKFCTILTGMAVFSCQEQVEPPSPEKSRVMEWGERYFDLTRDVNTLENTLDLEDLEKLFGARFDIEVPFMINDRTSLRFCPVPFRDQIYCVSEPLWTGSFSNSTFGYDFYIRKQGQVDREEDTGISIHFDSERRLVSVAFRDEHSKEIYGGTTQLFVDPDTIEPSIQLAAATRAAMRRAMGGDNHGDHYWNRMPNFVEKFVIAVDNHVRR